MYSFRPFRNAELDEGILGPKMFHKESGKLRHGISLAGWFTDRAVGTGDEVKVPIKIYDRLGGSERVAWTSLDAEPEIKKDLFMRGSVQTHEIADDDGSLRRYFIRAPRPRQRNVIARIDTGIVGSKTVRAQAIYDMGAKGITPVAHGTYPIDKAGAVHLGLAEVEVSERDFPEAYRKLWAFDGRMPVIGEPGDKEQRVVVRRSDLLDVEEGASFVVRHITGDLFVFQNQNGLLVPQSPDPDKIQEVWLRLKAEQDADNERRKVSRKAKAQAASGAAG